MAICGGSGPDGFGAKLCDALGLKRVIWLEMRVAVDETVRIKCEQLLDDPETGELLNVLKEYQLEAIESSTEETPDAEILLPRD